MVLAAVVVAALAVVLGIGLGFAGSSDRIAGGVTVAGVDVSGLSAEEAIAELERRAAARAQQPSTLVAGGRTVQVTPASVELATDWRAAVEQARAAGEGFGPLRGFKRLKLSVSGIDIAPRASAYPKAIDYYLDRLGSALEQPAREGAIELRGLQPVVVPGQAGIELDRDRGRSLALASLSSLEPTRVELPLRRAEPRVTPEQLDPVAEQVRTAVSAPVTLRLGTSTWRIRPGRVAAMLVLPRDGETQLRIGGAEAKEFFATLREAVNRPATSAEFVVNGDDTVSVVDAEPGRKLDVAASRRAILAAAVSPTDREAELAVETVEPRLTTGEARAMGIVGLVGRFQTSYGGVPNRLANVRLVASLIDNRMVAPGGIFSFNETTGERNAEKGFRKAPVIINGELQTALGGGVCQVSTTVFNAAYEAGLPIRARTNHALYISHYPRGRDATVDYPRVDLQFENDTGKWLLVRVGVGESSLTVSIYGTPTGRRVVTEPGRLRAVERPEIEKVLDASLPEGTQVVQEPGAPARQVTVRRLVYNRAGELIDENAFTSFYLSEKRVIRVGTAPVVEEPEPEPVAEPAAPVEDPGAGEAEMPPAAPVAPADPAEAPPAEPAPAPAEPAAPAA